MINPYKAVRTKRKNYYTCKKCGKREMYIYYSARVRVKLCVECFYNIKRKDYVWTGNDENIPRYKECQQCGKTMTKTEFNAGAYICWDCWAKWVKNKRAQNIPKKEKEKKLIRQWGEFIDLERAGINFVAKVKNKSWNILGGYGGGIR